MWVAEQRDASASRVRSRRLRRCTDSTLSLEPRISGTVRAEISRLGSMMQSMAGVCIGMRGRRQKKVSEWQLNLPSRMACKLTS